MANTKKSHRKGMLVGSIIFTILFLMVLTLVITVPKFLLKDVKLSDTTTITVTLSDFAPVNQDSTGYVRVNTEEYGAQLFVRSPNEIVDLEAFNNLQIGQKLLIRIKKGSDKNNLGYICSLETQDKQIVTLESHNSKSKSDRKVVQIVGTVFSLIFLIVALFFFFAFKKNYKN